MVRRSLTVLLVAIASCICYSQVESQVRVRVLDYKTGRPVQRHTVGLLLPDDEGEIRNNSRTLLAKTGRDGIAVFRITKPLPPRIWVSPEHSMGDWSCTATQDFRTSDVFRVGVVGAFENHPLCKHHTTLSATAEPGEVVVYLRHLNGWLSFRRFLHEVFNG
jgi:hypothetical protein